MTTTTSTTPRGAHRTTDDATGAWFETADMRTEGGATPVQVTIGYVGPRGETPCRYMTARGGWEPTAEWFRTEDEARAYARQLWTEARQGYRAPGADLPEPAVQAVPVNRPRVTRTGAKVTTEGFYQHDGQVYRVLTSKTTGNLWAKRLDQSGETDAWSWSYAQGAMAYLSAEEVMTTEEAAAFGRATGTCAFCGLELTDPKSIERGIGPVCWGKHC